MYGRALRAARMPGRRLPPRMSSAAAVTSGGGGGLNTFGPDNFSPNANPCDPTVWFLGANDGLDWNNPQSSSGHACGTTASPGSDTDNTACRKGTFARKQFVQATCFRQGGYSPAVVHEIELLLHCTISAHSITTYECLFNSAGNFQLARWDGALDNVNFGISVTNQNGGPIAVVDGQVVKVQDDGAGNFSLFQAGTLVATWSDSTWTGGAPGHAYFWRPDASIVPASMGWTNMTGGEY